VLPIQASSVPCERLFSAGKEIAVARRSQLGAKLFEQLQMLKFAWKETLVDHATWNSEYMEVFDLDEFKEMLVADGDANEWDDTDSELEVFAT
jgi:hypothetical protein